MNIFCLNHMIHWSFDLNLATVAELGTGRVAFPSATGPLAAEQQAFRGFAGVTEAVCRHQSILWWGRHYSPRKLSLNIQQIWESSETKRFLFVSQILSIHCSLSEGHNRCRRIGVTISWSISTQSIPILKTLFQREVHKFLHNNVYPSKHWDMVELFSPRASDKKTLFD